jgi:hypothetical protein
VFACNCVFVCFSIVYIDTYHSSSLILIKITTFYFFNFTGQSLSCVFAYYFSVEFKRLSLITCNDSILELYDIVKGELEFHD